MFRPFKTLNNESGIVLFIVLMTAVIIIIISASILSQSMNEVNYAQQQIDQIATDQLAKGMFWNAYSTGMQYTVASSAPMQGRTYQMTYSNSQLLNNPITNWQVNASYDTFN